MAGSRRLFVLFALLVAGVVLAVNGALALLWHLAWPFGGYPRLFFETNTALVLLFVLGGWAVETLRLAEGGAHVARLAGGREADRDERLERRLHNVVTEMAIAANSPRPAAWVLPREPAINAFAAGWSADDGVVVLTRGALEKLDRAELQGVVAHEISHLVHGDTRLNMRLIGLVWGLRMVFDFGRELTERGDDGRRPATVPIGLLLMTVGVFGWLAGRLLQAAVSRQREFLADASAVKYTRQVDALGGALRKIADEQARAADALHASAGPLAHLFLARRGRWSAWATHPPLAERLARLYGRTVLPLPAVASDTHDAEMEPLLPALVPASPLAGGPQQPVDPEVPTPAARPDAFHAALEREADEAERLARVARWHSPLELRATLLVLVGAGHAAWSGVPAHVARSMQPELEALPAAARETALDALAQRAALEPMAWRLALLRDARGGAGTPAGLLRWLLLRRRLCGAAPVAWKGRALDDELAAAAAATRALEACLPSAPPAAAAWRQRALGMLDPALAVRPAGPASARAALKALARLHRVAPLQRPRLARAWMEAAAPMPAAERRAAELLLGHALALLGLALPAELAKARPPWPAQDRSL